MTTNIRKITTLLTVLIIGATMSGCISEDITPIENTEETTIIIKYSAPREPTEIESLINDLMLYTPAGKTRYNHNPNKTEDVHISINKAIDQAEWIIGNYNYETGIVMMWNKYIGDDHAQTWVDVNGTRYVIDSTSNYYWTVEKHADHWSSKYKIQYTTVQKGLQFEKESNENLNNKDA